jgi:hypothetical protein
VLAGREEDEEKKTFEEVIRVQIKELKKALDSIPKEVASSTKANASLSAEPGTFRTFMDRLSDSVGSIDIPGRPTQSKQFKLTVPAPLSQRIYTSAPMSGSHAQTPDAHLFNQVAPSSHDGRVYVSKQTESQNISAQDARPLPTRPEFMWYTGPGRGTK